MPKKGTKKVRGHTRSKTLFDLGDGYKIKDPLSTTYVRTHFRKKRK
jgi:hypothetical protein